MGLLPIHSTRSRFFLRLITIVFLFSCTFFSFRIKMSSKPFSLAFLLVLSLAKMADAQVYSELPRADKTQADLAHEQADLGFRTSAQISQRRASSGFEKAMNTIVDIVSAGMASEECPPADPDVRDFCDKCKDCEFCSDCPCKNSDKPYGCKLCPSFYCRLCHFCSLACKCLS